jgi:hypothetical protein
VKKRLRGLGKPKCSRGVEPSYARRETLRARHLGEALACALARIRRGNLGQGAVEVAVPKHIASDTKASAEKSRVAYAAAINETACPNRNEQRANLRPLARCARLMRVLPCLIDFHHRNEEPHDARHPRAHAWGN